MVWPLSTHEHITSQMEISGGLLSPVVGSLLVHCHDHHPSLPLNFSSLLLHNRISNRFYCQSNGNLFKTVRHTTTIAHEPSVKWWWQGQYTRQTNERPIIWNLAKTIVDNETRQCVSTGSCFFSDSIRHLLFWIGKFKLVSNVAS